MADVSSLYEKIVRSTREVLKRVNELDENEERLETVCGIQETRRHIEHKKQDDGENTTAYNRKKRAVEHTWKSVVDGDFIPVIATKAVLSDTVRKLKEGAMAVLPEYMRTNVNEAERCLINVDERFILIDEILARINSMMKKAMCSKERTITEEEKNSLEWDGTLLERELATCKRYLDGATKAVNMLISDIKERYTIYGISAGLFILATFATGFGIAGKMGLSFAAAKTTGEKVVTGGLGLGSSTLTVLAMVEMWQFADSRISLLKEYKKKMEYLMQEAEQEYGNRQIQVYYQKKSVGELEVK